MRSSDDRSSQQRASNTTSPGAFAGLLFSMVALLSTWIFPVLTNKLEQAYHTKWTRYQHVPTTAILTFLWGAAQVYFVIAILLTLVINSRTGSLALISSIGVPWAVSQWIPYSLLGIILNDDLRQPEVPIYDHIGTVMALHNTAISAPQILSALISSLLSTALLQFGDTTAWVLRTGAVWMAAGAFLSFYCCSSKDKIATERGSLP